MKEDFQKPIKTSSIEEHEKILEEKMTEIQLLYVDAITAGKIPPLDKNIDPKDIITLISRYTEIPSNLCNEYYNRVGNFFKQEEYELFKQKLAEDIYDIYKKDQKTWIEETQKLIKDKIEKLGPIEKKEKQKNDSKFKAGLIDFHVEAGLGHLLPGLGVNDDDLCVTIHFPSFYKQKKDNVNNLFSLNSLKELALKIIEEYPETTAIVGESWLMDTPIAKRIGFKVFNRDSKQELTGQFWGQFINSSGQVDSIKVSKFLETGEPTFKVCIGVMMVEDFLKKYLPEEKRGKILLKKARPGLKDFNEKLEKEKEIFENILKNYIDDVENENIEEKIYQCEIIGGFLKTEQGKDLIGFLKELKKNNVSLKDIKEKNLFEEYKKLIGKYIDKLKFVDKKVVI